MRSLDFEFSTSKQLNVDEIYGRQKERSILKIFASTYHRARQSFFDAKNWLPSKQPINSASRYWQWYNESPPCKRNAKFICCNVIRSNCLSGCARKARSSIRIYSALRRKKRQDVRNDAYERYLRTLLSIGMQIIRYPVIAYKA